jgi:hypothetical protein
LASMVKDSAKKDANQDSASVAMIVLTTVSL